MTDLSDLELVAQAMSPTEPQNQPSSSTPPKTSRPSAVKESTSSSPPDQTLPD